MKKFFIKLIIFLFVPFVFISSIRVVNGKSPIYSFSNMVEYIEMFPTDSLNKFNDFIDKWNSNSQQLEEITESFSSSNDVLETIKLLGKVIVSISKYLFLVFELLFILIGVLFDSVHWVLKLPMYIIGI